MMRSPSFRIGILPAGAPAAAMAAAVSGRRSAIGVSVNGRPERFNTSQGRKDQLDHSLSPITSSKRPS